MRSEREPGSSGPGKREARPLLLAPGLALLTLLTFLPALDNGFVAYDDDLYVTANPGVQQGITAAGLRWALAAVVAENWHPVTLASHMLDAELFGLDPRGHHLTSLVLHAANVLLLFSFLRRTTGASWRSAAAAALFAVHPTRVESVAWVAERKDVLSGLFFFLCLLAYARYAERPSLPRYLAVVAALALGLAAKPMLVTLPFVLLLLDLWPLGRFRPGRLRPLLLEKLPLLALSAAASAATLVAQRGALAEALPLGQRLANALVAYATYLGKILLPRDLAVFYPMPPALPTWKVAGAALLLAVLTAAALQLGRRATYLPVGWFWFLGMLVPVIGLVQVGSQSMADRYTYLPAVGLFLIAAWGLPDALPRRKAARPILTTATLAAILVLALAARAQTVHWRNTITLFHHAAAVTEGNYVAHLNLAEALREAGRREEALEHYRAAIAARPRLPRAYAALGGALRSWGHPAEALPPLRTALELDPTDARTHATLAMALDDLDRTEEAIAALRRALELDPSMANARRGLELLQTRSGGKPPGGRGTPPLARGGAAPRSLAGGRGGQRSGLEPSGRAGGTNRPLQ